jgi:hypothetical protein
VLAANAAWRAEVVPSPPPEPPETAEARRAKRLTRHPRLRLAGERPSWSDLLERVFRVDGFACPGCGGPLTLRCVVVNPPVTRRIGCGRPFAAQGAVIEARPAERLTVQLKITDKGLLDCRIHGNKNASQRNIARRMLSGSAGCNEGGVTISSRVCSRSWPAQGGKDCPGVVPPH